MANLEIKVDTGDAASKLEELAQGLDKAAASADKAVPSFDKLDEAAKKAADVKPIDQAVPDSIDKTGEAAKKLGEAAPGVDSAAAALNKVGETAGSLSSAAAAAEQAAAATEKVAESATKAGQASEGLGRFAEGASKAGEGARNTEAATSALDSAFARIGHKAMETAEHMTGFSGAAGLVSKAFSTIMEVGGGLPGVLAGVVTAIAGIDFSKISEEALKAAMQVENLQRALNVWSKDAHQAPEALEILDKTADRLGINLDKLEKNFGKFAATAMSAGFSAKFAATAFDAVENAARATGTGAEGAQRVLRTLETWMSTGTMTAGLLGRSLKDVGITLDQIDPKFKNLTRNTQMPVEAFNKLLIAMNNIATVALTLQEQTERVANSWTMMLGAFGRGQMAAEVDSMKVLADTMHHAQSELNSFAYAAGAMWGVLQSVFNYIEAAAVGAFGGLIAAVKTVWDELSKASFIADDLKAAWAGIAQGATIVADALGPLAHEILPTLKVLAQSFVLGLYALNLGFKELGEDIGILAGAIGGMLYLAFFKVIDAIKSFIDWLNSGLEAMKSWMSSGLPEWLSGPLTTAIEKVQSFFKSIRDEWNEGVAAAAALRDQTDQEAKAIAAAGAAAEDAAKKQRQLTLENEKLTDSSKKAMEAEIAKRAAMIFADPAMENAMAASAASQKTADAYWNQMRQQWAQQDQQKGQGQGQGRGDNQNHGPLGTYPGEGQSYYDRLKQLGYTDEQITTTGTGKYDTRPGSMGNPETQAEQRRLNEEARGQGQEQFGNDRTIQNNEEQNAANQKAFERSSEQKSITDQIAKALGTLSTVPDFFKESEQQRIDAEQAIMEREQKNADRQSQEMNKLDDAMKGVDDAMTGVDDTISGLDTSLQGIETGMGTLSDGLNGVSDGLDTLDGTMQGLDASVQADAAAVQSNTISNWESTFATEQNTISQDANTDATQADTAANYADAAAQSSGGGGGGGGNNDQGGGGGGGEQLYMDVGGVVGQWGGRSGPALPASAWINAPHFDAGGLTGGGIPIVAHPDEAIIPLKNGSVPVQLGSDLGEKIITVGTVAHEDANRMIELLQKIANGDTNLLTAFNIVAARLEAAASRASSGGSSSLSSAAASASGAGSGAGGDGSGGDGMGAGGEGSGIRKRGYWGTSNMGGYLLNNQTNMYQSGPQWFDAAGHQIPMAAGADGISSTNYIPGMSPRGAPVILHPDEAVIPLPDGRSIPVHFPSGGNRGITAGPGVSGYERGTVINHYHNTSVNVRDPKQYASKDQVMQRLLDNIYRSVNTIGRTSQVDDPTRRPGWGGQAPGMTNPGVRGGPFA